MSRISGPFHLYVLTCKVNGKKYVGITTQKDPRRRLIQHKHDARNGAQTPLHNAIRKHGIDKFEFEVVATASTWKALCRLERYYISKCLSLCAVGSGYNVSKGGEGAFGAKRSKATREKLSKIVTQYYKDNPGAREHNRRISMKLMQDPARRKKSQEGARRAWQNQEYRDKRIEQIRAQANQPEAIEANRRRAIMRMADPKNRERLRMAAKRQMSDPANREMSRQGAINQWKDSEYRNMMRSKMARVARKQWQNPTYRKRMSNVQSRPIIASGEKFDSLNAAAAALGVKANTICTRLKNQNYPDYYYLPRREVIRILGRDYESISAAARATGMSYGIVYRRIKDPEQRDYQRIQLDSDNFASEKNAKS